MNSNPGGCPVLYATPPMRIGKKEWRCIVKPWRDGSRCTVYEFRCPEWQGIPAGRWMNQCEWPGWDGNDTYLGLPKSLEKLYRKHEKEISEALAAFHLVA